jgi:NADH:ubiquinone oxidoreductase subunit 2 (subunit N)
MAARPQLPGMHYFLWMRIASLRTGVLTGIYLSCVLVAWLEIANRVAELEPYAEARNLLAGAILIMVLGIPVLRFRHQPGKLFVAGLAAWSLMTMTYLVAGLHFKLLESRMGGLHFFMLGAVSYGFVAVLDWVYLMCAVVRHEHMAQSRESTFPAGRHRTH